MYILLLAGNTNSLNRNYWQPVILSKTSWTKFKGKFNRPLVIVVRYNFHWILSFQERRNNDGYCDSHASRTFVRKA